MICRTVKDALEATHRLKTLILPLSNFRPLELSLTAAGFPSGGRFFLGE